MKNTLIVILLIISIVSVSFLAKKELASEPLISSKTVTQVAIIVRDIEKARNSWAQTLGITPPEVSVAGGHPSRPTLYKGKPSDAKAKLAFISMENLQIELIEPMGGKSTWQEFLDKNGEGIHHIAFWVKDINGMEKKFEMQGMPTVMSGGWDGGAYSYISSEKKLGCIIELLENYK